MKSKTLWERGFAEIRDRNQQRRTARFMRRIARRVLRGPPDEKDAPWKNGAPKSDNQSTQDIAPETLPRQVPATVTGIYDFALACFAEKLSRADGSPERFRESLPAFFLPFGTPREDRSMLPERAFVEGAVNALVALAGNRQMNTLARKASSRSADKHGVSAGQQKPVQRADGLS